MLSGHSAGGTTCGTTKRADTQNLSFQQRTSSPVPLLSCCCKPHPLFINIPQYMDTCEKQSQVLYGTRSEVIGHVTVATDTVYISCISTVHTHTPTATTCVCLLTNCPVTMIILLISCNNKTHVSSVATGLAHTPTVVVLLYANRLSLKPMECFVIPYRPTVLAMLLLKLCISGQWWLL